MQLKLTGKLIAYIRNEEKPQINNLKPHFRKLGNKQNKPKANRKKKIIKVKAETDEIENNKTVKKTNETKS